MNTSKTLLQILVEELPNNGGWPDSNRELNAIQDKDCEIKFHYSGELLKFEKNNKGFWGSDSPDSWLESDRPGSHFCAKSLAIDCATAIITRDQYEAALASSKEPLTGTGVDGWIDWAGGKIPVDKKALVDLKFRDSVEYKEVDAGDFYWPHTNSLSDIIAYRLHQTNEASLLDVLVEREVETRETIAKATDDLNECIGQVRTDEDVLRDYNLGKCDHCGRVGEIGSKCDHGAEDTTLLIHFLLDEINDADVNIRLDDAYELAQRLIDVGYRKQ